MKEKSFRKGAYMSRKQERARFKVFDTDMHYAIGIRVHITIFDNSILDIQDIIV